MPKAARVISETEILALVCPTCQAPQQMACRVKGNRNIPLTTSLEQNDLTFHVERVEAAQQMQLMRNFGRFLGPTEKSLIVYYAFVMLSDAVAAKAMLMIGKEFTSQEVQAFFAQMAIQELKRDKLL